MIGTIAMAVGSVVAKQAATIAFNRTVCWIKAKKGTNVPETAHSRNETTLDDVITSMDMILEWSDE